MSVACQHSCREQPLQHFAEMVPTVRTAQKSGEEGMGKQREQLREAEEGKGAQQSFLGEEEGRETLFQSGGVNGIFKNLI